MVDTASASVELGATTLVFVAVLVGIRAPLWAIGVEGMGPTGLSAGIITGAIFVMGLVVAGTQVGAGSQSAVS